MTRLVPSLLLGWLLACGASAPSERPSPRVAPPPAQAAASSPLVLVEASTTVPLDATLPRLDVGEHAVTLDGQVVVTLSERGFRDVDVVGQHGYLVRSIVDVLEPRSDARPRIALAFDGATPYRTVARVVYTVGQTQRSELQLVVRTGIGERALAVTLPTFTEAAVRSTGPTPPSDVLSGVSPSEEIEEPPSLERVVFVRREGVFMRSAGGWVVPGCRDVAEAEGGPIAPRHDGVVDWRSFRLCFETLHEEHANAPDLRAAIVVADADVPFEDVAQTVAALRGSPDRPLVPEVTLAAPER